MNHSCMNPQMQNLEYIKLIIGLEYPGIWVSIVGTGSNQPQIPRNYCTVEANQTDHMDHSIV